MADVAIRLQELQHRVQQAALRAGRRPQRVRLLGVAKTATPEGLQAAWDAGLRDFGHNRIQALEEHQKVLPEACWHVIGPLQSNKIRRALEVAACLQSLSELRLGKRLARVLEEQGRQDFPCLIQVNLQPEDGRHGCPADQVRPLIEQLAALPQLKVAGLMTLGPHRASEKTLRQHFATLNRLAETLVSQSLLPPDPEISMGMTEDFEWAVEEGATLVRIGRALFPPQN